MTENQARRLVALSQNLDYAARPIRCNSKEWIVWSRRAEQEVEFDDETIRNAEWQ